MMMGSSMQVISRMTTIMGRGWYASLMGPCSLEVLIKISSTVLAMKNYVLHRTRLVVPVTSAIDDHKVQSKRCGWTVLWTSFHPQGVGYITLRWWCVREVHQQDAFARTTIWLLKYSHDSKLHRPSSWFDGGSSGLPIVYSILGTELSIHKFRGEEIHSNHRSGSR